MNSIHISKSMAKHESTQWSWWSMTSCKKSSILIWHCSWPLKFSDDSSSSLLPKETDGPYWAWVTCFSPMSTSIKQSIPLIQPRFHAPGTHGQNGTLGNSCGIVSSCLVSLLPLWEPGGVTLSQPPNAGINRHSDFPATCPGSTALHSLCGVILVMQQGYMGSISRTEDRLVNSTGPECGQASSGYTTSGWI